MHKDDIALICGRGIPGERTVSLTLEEFLRMQAETLVQAVIASQAIEGENLSEEEIEFLYQDAERRVERALAKMDKRPVFK